MTLPIDHLVIAVHNLDAAAAFYQRLGFRVGGTNQHPWGTHNRLIQLQGSFLELIALGPDFSKKSEGVHFASFLKSYLIHRQGLAMLALATDHAQSTMAVYNAAKISVGPLFPFSRKGQRPDGNPVEVGFNLAFAESPLIEDAGFFACQHTIPENFWAPELQRHDNGAVGIAAAIMVANDPANHAEFLAHFTGQREMLVSSMGIELQLGRGRLEVLSPLGYTFKTRLQASDTNPHFAAIRMSVTDISACERHFVKNNVPFTHADNCLIVAPEDVFGVGLLFAPDA